MNKIIIVGNEYTEAFNSIAGLISGGCFKDLPYTVSNGIISDGINNFRLGTTNKSDTSSTKLSFQDNGATWFDNLRSKTKDNSDALWTSFIENVGIEYHKRFSVVEYESKISSNANGSALLDNVTQLVNNFVDIFYPDFSSNINVLAKSERDIEDIYGLAMRIELSGGSGASLPILAKIFFSKNGNTMKPIVSSVAKAIELGLKDIIPDSKSNNATEEIKVSKDIIDNALNALEDIVTDTNGAFSDYMVVENEEDKQALNSLVEKMSHDAFEIECQRIDVLYISHVKSDVNLFDAYFDGEKLFDISVGLNDLLTIKCSKCGANEPLVNRNEIQLFDTDIDCITLDTQADRFGLSDEDIDLIKQYSNLKDHYMTISCSEAKAGINCKLIKCRSQLFETQVGDTCVLKCNDCPYLDIVFRNANGDRLLVQNAVLIHNRLELTNKDTENIGSCVVCGRYFDSSLLRNKKCPVCQKISGCNTTTEGTQLYKKYKNLLPLGVRFKSLSKPKGCVEDNEFIFFNLDSSQYVFDKLNVKKTGYIEQPKKI